VIHGLPNTSLCEAYFVDEEADSDKNIWDLLERETGIPQTEIRNIRILCRKGEEDKGSALSLRVMVEDPTICDRLCKDGAFLLSRHCRVSRIPTEKNNPPLETVCV
jgi:hypothetical protein